MEKHHSSSRFAPFRDAPFALRGGCCGVMEPLSSNQPNCPQLYICSSADQIILAKSVESFVEKQRKAGCEVRSCHFVSSPHVDHYRSNPALYTSHLTNFLEDCVLARHEDSSPSPA